MTRGPSIIDVAPLTADRVEPFEGLRPYVATGAMTDSGITETEMVTFEERPSRADLQVRPGDVCIARMRSTEKCFVFDGGCEDLILSTGFAVFRPDRDQLDPAYLAHYLRTERFQQSKDRLCTGAVQPAITNAGLGELTIPLPSLEEQKRIAAILDAADNLRTKRRQAIAKLGTLTQAIFHDMFGDLATNERGWSEARVSDFVSGFESGKSIAGGSDDEGGQLRVLKVSAVTSRRFKASESKPVPRGYVPAESHFVREGDLLMSRANTVELVGRCAFVRDVPSGILLPDKLWRFVWQSEGAIDPHFVWFALQDRSVRRQIENSATGSSGSMKNISQKKFMSVVIPLPPAANQKKFGAACKKLNELESRYQKDLDRIDELFRSIQQRAFQGEL